MVVKNFDGYTYRAWEALVDERMFLKHGVGIDDIPDMPYNDWFMDDVEIEDAIQMAIDEVNKGGF